MAKRFRLLLLTLFFGLLSSAEARTDSLVQHYFQDLRSLRAEFIQTVFDAQARPLEISSGQVIMQKPGQFRWDYQEPYPQIIVADGERLWLYDVGLEQVTVRALDQALSSTPLALLSGAAPLDEAFTVSAPTEREGIQWFELTPTTEQPEFTRLRIAFQNGALYVIELEDMLNQRTRLSFERLERNVALAADAFRFIPPAGVDVVGDIP